MPTPNSAQLIRSTPFSDQLGEPIRCERRMLSIDTIGGPVIALLVVAAIGVHALPLHLRKRGRCRASASAARWSSHALHQL